LALENETRENRLRTRKLEAQVADSEAGARRQAERLAALWLVANNPTLRGPELVSAMLRQGAAAIRSGQRFRGVLGFIDGADVEVIGVGVVAEDDDPIAAFFYKGRRTTIEKTLIPRVGRTQAWNDLASSVDPPPIASLLGWRAALSTQFVAGDLTYSLTYASSEPTTIAFDAEDIAYIELLGSFFANHLQMSRLEESLRDEEERSRHHAERLEALWAIVNEPNLREEEMWLAMLAQGAAAIRPGQVFRGFLWRVQGADVVLEAVTSSPGLLGTETPVEVGFVLQRRGTTIEQVLAEGGGTRSWDDIQAAPFVGANLRAEGTRAFILSTFTAGGSTWVLAFSSLEKARTSLGPQDHTYIEVLASFFANQLQQRWQVDRLRFAQSHDVLTGLLNRSQFRSQARMATTACARHAVIVVDVDGFHEINESYGHMIGDALLVEVGGALQRRVSSGEIIGRLGGDVFAIYVANPASSEVVRARARDFAEAFARAFSTGDREGKDFITLTASLGVALAPEDGLGLDAILAHADAALCVAKERGHGSTAFYEQGMEGS
jgi:diguanylate cyclase (GGDEF)-like protein